MSEADALEFLEIHGLNLRCLKSLKTDGTYSQSWIVERWNQNQTVLSKVGFGKYPLCAIQLAQQNLLRGEWE